jgi:hypothetical protein
MKLSHAGFRCGHDGERAFATFVRAQRIARFFALDSLVRRSQHGHPSRVAGLESGEFSQSGRCDPFRVRARASLIRERHESGTIKWCCACWTGRTGVY